HGSHQVGAGHARISRGCVTHNSLHWWKTPTLPARSERGRLARLISTSEKCGRDARAPSGRVGWRRRKGAAGWTRPLSTMDPGGGDGCRALWSLFSGEGTGRSPSPTGRRRPGGGRGRAARPMAHALPIATATKRVPWFDFTRIKTLRLPSLWASETALRTSAGEDTALPLTSRITSPI